MNPLYVMVVISALLTGGCVSSDTHEKIVTDLDQTKKAVADAKKSLTDLEQQKIKLEEQRRDLAAKLDASQKEVSSLQEEKQKLLTGTTTAQEEIARLQKQAAEMETEKARAANLTKLVGERDGEIAKLKQVTAIQADQLKSESEGKARLEQERAAKEAEIARLTSTQVALSQSLEEEIAKGDIRIKQVKDRLTINMVDRLLFDSGQADVKMSGVKVLKQVSDILKHVTDKQIRIEGHTDNVPIGAGLKDKFSTNWELSTARATSVVRYLEKAGVDRIHLSATGYADTKPIASNDTEEGKKANRRIEISLYPKDLSEVVK